MEHEIVESALPPDTIASLDTTLAPQPRLEDVVVRGLRARGAFGGRRRIGGPLTWLGVVAAAGIAFAVGVRVGRQTAPASPQAAATESPAGRVKRAGAEYITALASVRGDADEARLAALATFRIASDQIMRIAPTSDAAIAMRVAFPESFVESPPAMTTTASTRVIRF